MFYYFLIKKKLAHWRKWVATQYNPAIKGGSNSTFACWLAQQLPVKWSHQQRYVVRSPPAQTFHWYKG